MSGPSDTPARQPFPLRGPQPGHEESAGGVATHPDQQRLQDAIPFIRALAALAPERLVWGSDWPHIGFHSRTQVHDYAILLYRELDAGQLLDVLIEAVPDTGARRAILDSNPAMLYGFDR